MGRPPSFELSVSTFFDAAHRLLAEHYGTGTRLHGHTYQVVVSMRSDTIRDDGMVVDHYGVRAAIQRVRDRLHDSYLNDIAEFDQVNTTPEVIARYFWTQLARELTGDGIHTMTVEIAESPTTRVRYEASLDVSPATGRDHV